MLTADSTYQQWITPSDIPFQALKARDLEACVYWLFDAMGARDLEWRIGGSGAGAADGGRDLEAIFHVPSPDGEMEAVRWWVECKGRKGTVDPDEVKSAVNNAAVMPGLAYLLVVTNTTFSNPTRDWVKAWQAIHPLPKVKLWDHETLERLLCKHPQVILRLFSEALSPLGLLKVAQQRFWEKFEYAPMQALETFWTARHKISIDALELVALIANEFAHGCIADRPWAAWAKPQELMAAFQVALVNLPYLRLRAKKIGIDEQPVYAAIAHIILVLLQHYDSAELAHLSTALVGNRDDGAITDEVVEVLLMPIVDRLFSEMQDLCAAKCQRVMTFDEAPTLIGDVHPIKDYWRRLDPAGKSASEEPKQFFRIEAYDKSCDVGFDVNSDRFCPLFGLDLTIKNIAEAYSVVERVSNFRRKEWQEESALKGLMKK